MFRINRSLATFTLILLFALGQLGVLPAVAQDGGPRPEVREALRSDSTEPLRERPILPPEAGRKNLPRKELPFRPDDPIDWTDPVLQPDAGVASAVVGANFEGVSNRNGVLPPDTNGDIGPNHYVQTVNLSFAVYNRAGTLLYGPANSNTLWSGFGGPCQTDNDGDPIVLYDHLADRWLISQFALPNYPNGPFYQCIAVSQTPDPTGSWWRYQFLASNTKMNDYPKFSVWPDGYYMTANQFNAGSLNFAGTGAFVFERDKMLAGQSARMIYFDLASNGGGMLPADLDGPAPPAGAPDYFAQFSTSTQLKLWEFRTNWTTPASSTFQNVQNVTVAAFDANMCNYARNCIPQRDTTVKLDAISDRLMYRLQYRNFGSYQTLVTNHTVDVGSDHAGVRWYELRKTTASWAVQQQGTFAPDAAHRWMASVAMNGAGDMALGYSASSSSIYPSIRVTGRLASDPAGTMTQGETTIINGGGSQTHSASRWGDYSMMAVDPVDDCTFWYTTEYLAATGSAPWRTRVASIKLRDCGTPVDNPPAITLNTPAQGATVSGTVLVSATASDDHGVTQVQFYVDGNSIGTDTNGTDGWSVNWNTTASSDGSHSVSATATDTAGQTAGDSHTVNVSNAAQQTMHVFTLNGASANVNKSVWRASATITTHDGKHALLSGVTVTGAWVPGGSASCVTDATGSCKVNSANLNRKSVASVTFTVTGLAKTGYTDSGPDDVSTSITVPRP
jgi:hypothetical protein